MPIVISKQKIKEVASKTASNKAQTPASDPYTGPHADVGGDKGEKVYTPFIDRLSVVLTVPEGDGEAIHGNLMTQVKDKDAFYPCKAASGFKAGWRLPLPSLADTKKFPHLSYRWDGKHATKLRLEFVPIDLGDQGLAEMHATLASIIDNGWWYVIEHGRVTRVDISVDFPDQTMLDFHFLPPQGATTKEWRSDGTLQTFQWGKVKGNHTTIYDRGAKRAAQKKAWQGKTGIRVERRLKGLSYPLKDLDQLGAALQDFKLIERFVGQPPEEKDALLWKLFKCAADNAHLPAALSLLPEKKRTAYRKHFAQHVVPWWNTGALIREWPKMLAEIKLIDQSAWS